jgi:hypothetical protein
MACLKQAETEHVQGEGTMTEREKETMSDPWEQQSYADPEEPKATTAFPTIAIVVTALALICVVMIVVLFLT